MAALVVVAFAIGYAAPRIYSSLLVKSRAERAATIKPPPGPQPPGMRWIPGGEFMMGSDHPQSLPNEKPAHRVRVDGFWMDETVVINAQFRRFAEATGYRTVAERPVNWEELKKQLPPGTPRPPGEMLQPGSLVFTPPRGAVPLNDMSNWWRWQNGANWRHPEGPGSSIEGKDNLPVVHIAWDDAVAYAKWASKRLPTEAEWEFAARGGLDGAMFAWGNDFMPDGKAMANTYQGGFPFRNDGTDGYKDVSPVKTFLPNGYGLYDVAGNVWQWTADRYRVDWFGKLASQGGVSVNPKGPEDSYDPAEPLPATEKRVIRAGSFLCHESYCASYRVSARRGTPPDTGSSHVGFRMALSQEAWQREQPSNSHAARSPLQNDQK